MTKDILKLKKLNDTFLHQSKSRILEEYGKPLKCSDDEVWYYSRHEWGILKDEIIFIFEENIVVDIVISQYFLWNCYQHVVYDKTKIPAYKITKMS